MANQKITELTALTTPAVEDVLAIVDDPSGTPVTKKITFGNLSKQIIDATAKTANYTLTTSDRLIFVDASSGAVTISVPAASGNEGIVWIVKKIDSSANAVIIDPDGAETIDGDSSYSLTEENQSISFTSNGSNIVIISEKQNDNINTGDVVGPASSTDNAVARFDSTTGKIIQNSAATIDDSGNIATSGTVNGRNISVDGTKLDGIEAGADITDAINVNAAGAVMNSDYTPSHSLLVQQSGTGSPSSLSVSNNSFIGKQTGDIVSLSATTARTILNVEDGATANSSDAVLLNRANHTGTQLANTISDFSTAVAATAAVTANTAKVTNATHTGDVTGATTLTVQPVTITGKATVVADNADFILISDTSDSGNLKKALISSLPSGGISALVDDTTPELGGNLDCNNLDIGSIKLASFNGEIDNGNSGAADTINWTTGNNQRSTLTANCTFTFTAPTGVSFLNLKIIQDATGSRTVTWPAGIIWAGGVAPTLSTTANRVDIVNFYYDGTNYYGALWKGDSETLDPNIARLNVAQEYTRTQNFNMSTLVDGASISWDLSQNQVTTVTLSGNRTLANPTNKVAGATYILIVIQDGTGSRLLSYGTDYKFPGGVAPTLSTAANSIDVLSFVCDGSNMLGVASLDFS